MIITIKKTKQNILTKTPSMIVHAFNTSTLEAVTGSLPADSYSRF